MHEPSDFRARSQQVQNQQHCDRNVSCHSETHGQTNRNLYTESHHVGITSAETVAYHGCSMGAEVTPSLQRVQVSGALEGKACGEAQ